MTRNIIRTIHRTRIIGKTTTLSTRSPWNIYTRTIPTTSTGDVWKNISDKKYGFSEGHLYRCRRFYFTNGQVTKQDDPYSILGLRWGDGASSAEIKAAFRQRARELHPDVNTTDTPQQAHEKFQKLQKAYESIMEAVTGNTPNDADMEEWRMAIWRRGDRIALDRTDVAGHARKRPAPPATSKIFSRELGHPSGRGTVTRGEFLASDDNDKKPMKQSSSVGTGRNKWVKPKEFIPWNGGKDNNSKSSSPK